MRKHVFQILVILFVVVNPLTITSRAILEEPLTDGIAIKSLPINEPNIIQPNKASFDNGTWAQLTTTTFVADGDISEWDIEGIIPETFDGTTIYLAYDTTNVYVAVSWFDQEVNNELCHWNKIDTQDEYDVITGEEDILSIGFSNDTYCDLWTWTASERTATNYAYEHGGLIAQDNADGGNLPFIINSNGTDFIHPNTPEYDNTSTPILDHSTIPMDTKIKGWLTNTPTGSQTDVAVGAIHNGTHYVVEFVRALNTSQADDIVLDFTNNDLWFMIGVEDQNEAFNFEIDVSSHLIFDENTPAELSFNDIPSTMTESYLLQGTVFDDYEDYEMEVWVDEWVDTWGTPDKISQIDKIAGTWNYLLIFNEMDMPLGQINITITLKAKYEEIIKINQTTIVDDIQAPTILEITDIGENNPDGVDAEYDRYVTISIRLADDYARIFYLTATLYWCKDDGITLPIPMFQYHPLASTFNANITFNQNDDWTFAHNYTYFVQIWDTNNNKAISPTFSFHTQADPNYRPPTTTKLILGMPADRFIGLVIISTLLTTTMIIIVWLVVNRYKERRIN